VTDPGLVLRALLAAPLSLHLTGAAGGGYAPRPLPPDQWSVTATQERAIATATIVFRFTGPAGRIIGWRLEHAEGRVLAAESLRDEAGLPAPCDVRVAGSEITVRPTLEVLTEA
jgi:hypothetical protein